MKIMKILKIVLVVLMFLLIVGVLLKLFSDKETDEIDNSRVALTVTGLSNDKYTYVMFDSSFPNKENVSLFENGNTIIPKMMESDYDFISVYSTDSYMIELTSLLPYEYTSASEYFEDGGKIMATIFYYETDGTRVVSEEIIIEESGNHIIDELKTNGQKLNHLIEDFKMSVGNKYFGKIDFKDWFKKDKDEEISEYNEIINLPYDVIKIPSLSDGTVEC